MKQILIAWYLFNLVGVFLFGFVFGDVASTPAVLDEVANGSEPFVSQVAEAKGEDNLEVKLHEEAHVQSSFDEVVLSNENLKSVVPDQQTLTEIASQNSGIVTGTTDANPGVVYTLIDTAGAELKKAEIPSVSSQNPDHSSLNSNQTTESSVAKPVKIEKEEIEANDAAKQTENEFDVPNIDEPKKNETEDTIKHEDIPSFSEWTQKQLEEAEKKRELVNDSSNTQNYNPKQNASSKVRSKNYASPDCGAKIVAANPEATNAGAVLSSSKDEYYLNVCTNRIWFIVELCEAIQAKKIDIANFELFSSSPKDFTVSVNARFPSREWSVVGQFIAKEEKDVQSFDLHPHLFGKYIKVEVHSHYGSEHFCPISLFKVYGTSEFEVLEKEDAVLHTIEDDDDDETLDSEKGSASNNLFHSATNAVISMVKKAVEVMGNKGNTTLDENKQVIGENVNLTPLIGTCTTVSHFVQCENCTDIVFGQVYELLSCESVLLDNLSGISYVKSSILNTGVCRDFGLDFLHVKDVSVVKQSYLSAVFHKSLLGALCNRLAVIEDKALLNTSYKFANATTKGMLNNTDVEDMLKNPETAELNLPQETMQVDSSQHIVQPTEQLELGTSEFTLNPEGITEISYNTEIKPTKTLSPDDLNDTKSVLLPDVKDSNNKVVQSTETLPTVQPKPDTTDQKPNVEGEIAEPEIPENISEIFEGTTESSETIEDTYENIMVDLNTDTNSNSATAAPKNVPKESVFLRLSNRIKALERNMSLSSQYLEELSRRYKKQVEEMQKLLDKTLNTWNEERKQRDDRIQKLEEKNEYLLELIENLVADKNNWANATYWTFIIVIIVTGFFTFCRRTEPKYNLDDETKAVKVKRRKSIDIVRHKSPVKKKRRPSEEALKLTGGTYQHLLVDEVNMMKRSKERKRRRKKSSIRRSNSMVTLVEENELTKASHSRTHNRQESLPTQAAFNYPPERSYIEDIPIALEEADNSFLEVLPLKTDINKSISQPEYMNGHLNKLNDSLFTSFIKTARESRMSRTSVSSQTNGVENCVSSPQNGADNLNILDSVSGSEGTPKKEKKGIKRLFRKVF